MRRSFFSRMNADDGRSALICIHPRLTFLFSLRERPHVIHHVPPLLLAHAFLTGGHDALNPLGYLPEDLAIRHRGHPFFVRQVGGLATQFREVRLIARACLAVTKHAVALRALHVELFALSDRLGRHGGWVLRLVSVFRKLPGVLREVLLWAAAGTRRDPSRVILVFVCSRRTVRVLCRRRDRDIE